MSWASRRKSIYFSLFAVFLVLFVGVPLFLTFYKAPTCSDGKQNQRELGIDCSGPCPKICASQFLNPIIIWTRALRVTPNIYNVLAYVENPNLDGAARNVSYIFRLYDNASILITERRGSTYLLPHQKIPIFENAIKVGERVPTRVTFEWAAPIPWEKSQSGGNMLVVINKVLSKETTTPRLDAVIENRSISEIREVDVVAIVYDTNDNALAFSKTIIDIIPKNDRVSATFTWPEKFLKTTSRIEIVPLIRPR